MSFFKDVLKAIPIVGDVIGGAMNARAAESAGNKNADLQRQFAQNGVRWRVEDAKKAGIHPLAALGMTGASASPVYVGSNFDGGSMGQNIERAINATRTQEERTDRLGSFIETKVAAQQARDLQERHESREDLRLRSQLANDEVQRQYYNAQIQRLQTPPNPPIPRVRDNAKSNRPAKSTTPDGYPKKPGVEYKPDEVTMGKGGLTAGTHPAFTRYESPFGFDFVGPSQAFSEPLESSGFLGSLLMGAVPSIGMTIQNAAKHYGFGEKKTIYRQAPNRRYENIPYWKSPF